MTLAKLFLIFHYVSVGVGQLEDISTPEKLMEAQRYYEHIANLANEKGVTVSLLTLTGTECRILELGQVADKTNGEVSILTNPFRQIPWILGSEIPGFSMISLDFKEKFLNINHYYYLVVKINI